MPVVLCAKLLQASSNKNAAVSQTILEILSTIFPSRFNTSDFSHPSETTDNKIKIEHGNSPALTVRSAR